MQKEKLYQLESDLNSLIKEHYIIEDDELIQDFNSLQELMKDRDKYQEVINLVLEKFNPNDYKKKIDETKKKIKKLRENKQFEQAYQLTLLYPNCPIIQGQKFSVCLSLNRMNEVQQIVDKFYNHPRIQSKLCKLYLKEKQYRKVEKIASRFPNDEFIQSQLCSVYLKQKKYRKVEEIVNRFPTWKPIQSQLCTAYLKQKEYEKVEKIANKFPTYEPIQSQLCTVYLEQKKYEKLEIIANKFPTYEPIQSQLCTVYLEQGKCEKLEEIASRFPNNKVIQSKLFTAYIGQDLEGVDFKEYTDFNVYEFKEAKTLTEMNMFYFREKIYQEYLEHESMTHIINLLNQDILNIDPWEKTLMLIAINELRKNACEMKKIAKNYMVSHSQEKEQLKILKRLISEHRPFFDRGLYDDLLQWNKEAKIVKKYINVK